MPQASSPAVRLFTRLSLPVSCPAASTLSFWPFPVIGTGHATPIVVRKILAISPDERFLRALRWCLEGAGYVVLLSDSLEDSFLELGQSRPFLVIVDTEALKDGTCECEKFLSWFHRCSPILLMTGEPSPAGRSYCDYCLPKNASTVQLLSYISELQRQS
ncbi:MAG: DNA-binding response regulator [Acidobacteria bacterium]|nr:MAG: DNA-binding response regulator [Acidobacteriota bacterium]